VLFRRADGPAEDADAVRGYHLAGHHAGVLLVLIGGAVLVGYRGTRTFTRRVLN